MPRCVFCFHFSTAVSLLVKFNITPDLAFLSKVYSPLWTTAVREGYLPWVCTDRPLFKIISSKPEYCKLILMKTDMYIFLKTDVFLQN